MPYFLVSVLDNNANIIKEGYINEASVETVFSVVNPHIPEDLTFKVEKFHYPKHGALDSYEKFYLDSDI